MRENRKVMIEIQVDGEYCGEYCALIETNSPYLCPFFEGGGDNKKRPQECIDAENVNSNE